MRFLGWTVLVLVLLEVLSIVLVADWLGGAAAFLLMVIGFAVGLLMMRNIGLSTLLLAGESVRSRQNISVYQLLWPIRFGVAALLLMSPGFASDVLALALMLPFKGRALETADIRNGMHRRREQDDGSVIEGEYTVTNDAAPRPEATPPRRSR